ncbi:MAG: endonuclease/exonuclease/phosphatase family protein [Cyclobacteriaceae bacterium]
MAQSSRTSAFIRYLLSALVLSVVAAYFWGSSGRLSESELNQIIENEAQAGLGKDTLTVVSYNMGYLSGMTNNLPIQPDPGLYNHNLSRLIKMFQAIQPDLIGIQEIDYGSDRSLGMDQLDSLLKYCQIPFAHKSINWDKNYVPFPYWPPAVHFGRVLSGQAILSKYPVDRGERTVLENPDNQPFYYKAFYINRLIQVAHVSIDGKRLIVMNVHLEAYDRGTRERQAQHLLQVYRDYAKQYPTLLVGDFNARPPYAGEVDEVESTIQLFLDELHLSAAIPKQKYLANEEEYFTYSSDRPYEKIDYIFYNDDRIDMIDSYIVREAGEISDHLPVVMKFKLLP